MISEDIFASDDESETIRDVTSYPTGTEEGDPILWSRWDTLANTGSGAL
jgi:hypothetical protein